MNFNRKYLQLKSDQDGEGEDGEKLKDHRSAETRNLNDTQSASILYQSPISDQLQDQDEFNDTLPEDSVFVEIDIKRQLRSSTTWKSLFPQTPWNVKGKPVNDELKVQLLYDIAGYMMMFGAPLYRQAMHI